MKMPKLWSWRWLFTTITVAAICLFPAWKLGGLGGLTMTLVATFCASAAPYLIAAVFGEPTDSTK